MPVEEVRVDRGAGHAGKSFAPAAPGVKPPGTVLEKSATLVVGVPVDTGAGHPGKGDLPALGGDLEIEEDDSSEEECSGQGQMGTPAVAGLTAPRVKQSGNEEGSSICPGEDLDMGDGEWTRVGKKGKLKKKPGQPGVVAVQLQADGVCLQDVAPIPGRAEVPAMAVGKGCTSSSRVEDCKPHPKPYVPQWKKGRNRQSYLYFR